MCHEGGQWVQTTLSMGTASVNPGLDREPLKDLALSSPFTLPIVSTPTPGLGFPVETVDSWQAP